MGYTPDNNPYIPGDPYSYDLKWQVDKIKYMQGRFDELDADIQEATDQADRAEQEADFATEEADRATQQANNAAASAEDAAGSAADAAESEAAAKNYADNIADPVAGIVAGWLNNHIDPDSGYAIDNTLTVQNAAADAKVVGDKFTALKTSGKGEDETCFFDQIYPENIYTPTGKTDGYYLNTNDDSILTNTSYCYSKYLKVKAGTTYTFNVYTFTSYQLFVNQYDADHTFISGAVLNASSYTFTTDANAKYIRVSGPITQTDKIEVTEGTYKRNLYIPHTADAYNVKPGYLKNTRQIITVGPSDILRNAFDMAAAIASANNPCEIRVMAGTYNALQGYSAAEIADAGFYGLMLPNYTDLVGVGNVVIDCSLGSPSTKISTINVRHNSSIRNITFTGDNVRYVCHDDFVSQSNTEKYYREVEDCSFIGTNVQYGSAYGSGIKSGARWSFKNCLFKTDQQAPFTVHSWNTTFTEAGRIEFDNCVFEGHIYSIRVGGMSSGVENIINIRNSNIYGIWMMEEANDGSGIDFAVNVSGCSKDIIYKVTTLTANEYYPNITEDVCFLEVALSAIDKGDAVYRAVSGCARSENGNHFYGLALASGNVGDYIPIKCAGSFDISDQGITCNMFDKFVIVNHRLQLDNSAADYVAICNYQNNSVHLIPKYN